MKKGIWIVVIGLLAFGAWTFFGPDYWIKRNLRAQFEDYQVKEDRQNHLNSSTQTLHGIVPSVYARIAPETVKAIIKNELTNISELSELEISLGPQTIDISANFENRPPAEEGQPKKFRIAGKLAGQFYPTYDTSTRRLFYLPYLQAVNVTELQYEPGIGEDVAKQTVDSLIASILQEINGYLNQECSSDTPKGDDKKRTIPKCFEIIPPWIDVAIDVEKELNETDEFTDVSAEKVRANLDLRSAVVLVSENGVELMLEATHGGDVGAARLPESTNNKEPFSQKDYKKSFREKAKAAFGSLDQNSDLQIALSTGLTKSVVNRLLSGSGISLTTGIDDDVEVIKKSDVRLAKRPRFECRPDMSCNKKKCRKVKCNQTQTTTCTKDRGVIGKLIESACSAVAKTTCEGGKAVGSLICETVTIVDKGACEAAKSLKKAGCEGNKVFVDKALGRIGYINGDYRISGEYKVDIESAEFGDALSSISLSAISQAQGRASGHLRFVPVEHGHLIACVAPWKENFDVGVNIPRQLLSLRASRENISYDEEETLYMNYVVDSFNMKGKVSPAPFTAVFDEHPHLYVNCALPSAIGSLAKLVKVIDGKNKILPDELNEIVSGDIDRKIEDVRFSIKMKKREKEVENYKVTYKAFANDRVFGLTGDLEILNDDAVGPLVTKGG